MTLESQRAPRSRNYIKEDVEQLVCWMEENQLKLRGKQSVWHKDLKEQVFATNSDITVKRIGEKVQNMKNAWRNARKVQDQSGSGVQPEDNAPTFNALLESKCPFFWRLDGIWGTRQNVSPILILNSTQPEERSESPLIDPLIQDKDLLIEGQAVESPRQ